MRRVSLTPAVFHLHPAVDAVAVAFAAAPLLPRGPAFAPLLQRVLQRIQTALDCPSYRPIVFSGTGSSAMAAVLGSCLGANERVLVIKNGAYGDRLAEFARALQQPLRELNGAYGEHPDLAAIEAACADVDAVVLVHGETTSCNLNPVAAVAELCRRRGKKLFIDAVSTVFVEALPLAEWGVSAVMGSCNKALHARPNLALCLVAEALLEEMARLPQRVPSMELAKIARAQRDGVHPYTLDPLSLAQLDAALAVLEDEGGVAGRRAVYLQRAALLREGFARLGVELATWPQMPLASSGTALRLPDRWSFAALAERLAREPVEDHVFDIYSAQGPLSATTFRVFHMGHYPLASYALFLQSLERVLNPVA